MDEIGIRGAIYRYLRAEVVYCKRIGRGASGRVYKIGLNREPFVLAVKIVAGVEFLEKEVFALRFIGDRADIGLPKVYFSYIAPFAKPDPIFRIRFRKRGRADVPLGSSRPSVIELSCQSRSYSSEPSA